MRRLSLFEVSGGRELVICKGLAQPQLVQFASGGVGEFVDKFDDTREIKCISKKN